MKLILSRAFLIALPIVLTTVLLPVRASGEDWRERSIAPVANPLFFESPLIESEIRPLFMYHRIADDLGTGGGDVQVYAVEARWAVNDRLALIATKDGFIDFNPNTGLTRETGFADIGFGVKYAVVDRPEDAWILTPGIRLEVPTGNTDVFQGNGAGEWNVFLSGAKGFDRFHITGNGGLRIPNDFGDENAQAHYGLMVDYYTCSYFIPFAVVHGSTVLSQGDGLPLSFEGADLINFGASRAGGFTQVIAGGGFRSRLSAVFDLGFAYEIAVTKPKGLFRDRFTVDLAWRF